MIELSTPGVILNITSLGRAGNFGQSNYSAAKADVASITVTWAKELARHGIRVGAIAPGFCETRLVTGMKPDALDRVKAGIPLQRLGRPEEIAHSALYVFENDYFTGRVLEVDGGLRAPEGEKFCQRATMSMSCHSPAAAIHSPTGFAEALGAPIGLDLVVFERD